MKEAVCSVKSQRWIQLENLPKLLQEEFKDPKYKDFFDKNLALFKPKECGCVYVFYRTPDKDRVDNQELNIYKVGYSYGSAETRVKDQ